jgi:hypothetical protein
MNATPFDEGAAALGSNGRTEDRERDCNLARLPLTPPAHDNAPEGTSEVAADRIAGYAGTLRERVYAFIASRGADGATDDEGEAALGIKCQTYTPRRGELVLLGLVVDSGRRRKTASNRPAAVWIATNQAPKPATPGVEVKP